MKANELRIGNLVTLSNDEWNNVRIDFSDESYFSETTFFNDLKNDMCYANVCAILNCNEVELSAYGADLDYYAIGSIQPIPLTEEWLIKFGFIKYNSYSFKIKIGDIGVDVMEYDDGYFTVYLFNGSVNFKMDKILTNVHQLQNLYFALAGEELEIKTF